MSGPSINPIPTTKFLESATGSDHAPNEANAELRVELDKEELLETEYNEMGLPPPTPMRETGWRARFSHWLRRQ